MENLLIYMPVIASVGAINGLFALLFINSNKAIPKKSILFLNLLIVALILKIIYSFTFVIRSNHILTQLIKFSSYYGYLCFGPLLYLYYNKWLNSKFTFRIYHFAFFIAPVFLLIYLANRPNKLMYFQIYNLIFFVVTFLYLRRNLFKQIKHVVNIRWGVSLFVGFILIWMSANLLFIHFNLYIIEFTILLSVCFYFLIYYATATYWFKKSSKYAVRNTANNNVNKAIIQKVTETLEKTKVYKNSDLSLPKLAKLINVNAHQLSEAINVERNSNFNEFINAFRIEAITKALIDRNDFTIASIAYDYGFNSISTFNSNFKKLTSYTPSDFIKKYSINN